MSELRATAELLSVLEQRSRRRRGCMKICWYFLRRSRCATSPGYATVCMVPVEIALRADPSNHALHRGLSRGASLGVLLACAVGVMRSPKLDLVTKIGIPSVLVYSKQSYPDLCWLSTDSSAQFTGHAAGAPWLQHAPKHDGIARVP